MGFSYMIDSHQIPSEREHNDSQSGLDWREGRPTVVLLIGSFDAMHDEHGEASTIRNAVLALDVSEQDPSQTRLAF